MEAELIAALKQHLLEEYPPGTWISSDQETHAYFRDQTALLVDPTLYIKDPSKKAALWTSLKENLPLT